MEEPGRRHYATIEGLRAVAALAVVGYHVAFVAVTSEAVGRFAHHLEVGVPIFFVISGFVLFRPWAAGEPPSLGRYAARRALRIAPAFWVALTAALLLGLDRPSPEGTSPLVHYAFAQVFSADTMFQGLTVGWSLDVEVLFYVALPVVAWVLGRRAGSVRALAMLTGGGVVLALVARGLLAGHGRFEHASAVTFDWFLVGMLLAAASVAAPAWLGRLSPTILAGAAGVLFIALGAADLPWGSGGEYTAVGWAVQHVLYTAIGGLAVLAAVTAEAGGGGGLVRGALGGRPATWLGTVSFGIFLWHVPVLDALRKLGPFQRSAALTLAGVLVVTVPLAAASWYGIERPAMRLTRRRGPAPRGASLPFA